MPASRRGRISRAGIPWLEDNAAALKVELTAEDLAILDPLADQVVGSRY